MAAPMAAQRERVSECVPDAVMACSHNRCQSAFRDWRSLRHGNVVVVDGVVQLPLGSSFVTVLSSKLAT